MLPAASSKSPSSNRFGLAKALLVAALFSDVTSAQAWRRVWNFLTLWVPRKEKWAEAEIYHRRLACCHKCPFFFWPLATCGSPFADHPDAGCWCYEPVAARLADKQCWIDEEGIESEYGWAASIK